MNVKKFVGIGVAAALLSGCANHETAPQLPTIEKTAFPNWPNKLNGLRFRWTAAPNLDLLTGTAIPIRAYLESYRVGFMTKTIATTYPGFQRAVPEIPTPNDDTAASVKWGNLPFELQSIRPFVWNSYPTRDNFGDGPFFGNEYFHILDISEISNGYRTYVCDGTYGIFHPAVDHPGKYASIADYPTGNHSDIAKIEDATLNVWRIEFSKKTPTSGMQTPQKGPNPAPIGDVFGDWHIDGASTGNFWGPAGSSPSPQAPDYLQRLQQCGNAMPDNAAVRAKLLTSVLDSPPKADPAVPGWPDSAA